MHRCTMHNQCRGGISKGASVYENADRQPENIQDDGELLRYQSIATDLCI